MPWRVKGRWRWLTLPWFRCLALGLENGAAAGAARGGDDTGRLARPLHGWGRLSSRRAVSGNAPGYCGRESGQRAGEPSGQDGAFCAGRGSCHCRGTFGQKVEGLFDGFTPPVAAASIAQVHQAVLKKARKLRSRSCAPAFASVLRGIWRECALSRG